MSSMTVNLTRLQELYNERDQLHVFNSTHQAAPIFEALDPVEREINGLEAVTKASIREMMKDGYSKRQMGDLLVAGGLQQHNADSLIRSVLDDFKAVERELLRTV